MRYCTNCGYQLETGQAFCVACGTPAHVGGSEVGSAADPGATPPAVNRPASGLPPAPAAHQPQPSQFGIQPAPALPPDARMDDSGGRGGHPDPTGASPWNGQTTDRRGRAPILAIAVLLVLLATGGSAYLLTRPDTLSTKTSGGATAAQPGVSPSDGGPASQNPSPRSTTNSGSAATATASPRDLTALFTASAPSTATDARDAANNVVSYDPRNLLDGLGTTCWRTDGDASGQMLTFTMSNTNQIASVGLINGYAKIDQTSGADRYAEERRITAVTWLFDDGTTVSQQLADGDRALQTTQVPGSGAQSRTVRLRIDSTTPPGSSLDYTAISDVSIAGG